MAVKINETARLSKRLFPLYIAAFLHGFVLWYAIEKLFMRQIGFDDAGIGLMVAVYSALMIITETPSGILADRWSRKGVLMIASIFLGVSSLVCGLSQEPFLYLVGAVLWGIFYAFYTGTYDSIVYDTVQEETGKSEGYEKYYGRIKIVDSIALILGSLIGGVVGQFWGLAETYFLTIPLSLGALIALWRFREPQLHKAEAQGALKEHIVETFKSVIGRRTLIWLLITMVSVVLILDLLFEFSQLWLIAITTPAALFGPAFALILLSITIGGYLAGYIAKYRQVAMFILFGSMFLSALALTIVHSLILILAAQLVLGISVITLNVLQTRELHDALPSKVRAGAASAVSTMGRIVLIPIALGFGVLSSNISIFAAALILCVLSVIAVFGELKFTLSKASNPASKTL